jgi:hypothetical protein
MDQAKPIPELDDEEAERLALEAAVTEARADPRPSIPHAEVRAWLLKLAAGEFDAEPPGTR